MFIQGKTLATALSALAFLSHAIPSNAVGFGRPAHGVHHARSVKAASNEQAFAKRSSDISAQDVQQLQSEYTAFHGWVNTWLQTALQEDAATAVAQLKQEFTAYDSWMNTWLDSALNGASSGAGSNSSQPSAPAATILSSAPLPQSTSIASSEGLASPVGSTRSRASAAPYPTASMSQGEPGPTGTGRPSHSHRSGRGTRIHTATVASGAKPSHSHHSGKGTRIHTATVASGAKPHTASSGVAPIGTASTGKAPVDTTPTISATALSTASSKAAGGSSSASASGPSSSPSSHAGSGSFNAKAKDNVAVYYGQSAATTQVKLTDLCSDKDVDIVIMAFLTTFAGPGGYPSVNFGGACSGSASPAMTAKGATGLLSCPDLGTQIKTCQSAGKKVMLSLGGADASSAFTSDDQATKFATQLWNLFGAGTGEDAGLRPFGAGVTVDGFDIGKSYDIAIEAPNQFLHLNCPFSEVFHKHETNVGFPGRQ